MFHNRPSPFEFQTVCEEIKKGEQLTFSMIGRVFGEPFWILLVTALTDSKTSYEQLVTDIQLTQIAIRGDKE